jgi:Heterokaryon incompatibility protein (HET)
MTSLTTALYPNRLEGDQFRLLRIDSIQENLIECTLITTRLSEHHKFYALSYCWGDVDVSGKLRINGEGVTARENLVAALRHIPRYLDETWLIHLYDVNRQCRYIWIDALCINQADKEEKKGQIPRMDQFYGQAASVIVWLGDEGENTSCAMSVINALDVDKAMQENRETLASEVDYTQRVAVVRLHRAGQGQLTQIQSRYGITEAQILALKMLVSKLERMGPEHADLQQRTILKFLQRLEFNNDLFPPDHPFWLGWMELYRRPWFSRVWTFQEIALAKEAVVLCGSKWISWKLLFSFGYHLLRMPFGTFLYDFSLGLRTTKELIRCRALLDFGVDNDGNFFWISSCRCPDARLHGRLISFMGY